VGGDITPHLGDSCDVLPKILANINSNIVFWLDGHYSGGNTGGKEFPCPLLKELEIILARNNEDIIIIDDARCLFNEKGWPSISELHQKIKTSSVEARYMVICDDNIYIIPDIEKYTEPLLNYVLDRYVFLWNKDNLLRNPPLPKK